MSLCVCDPTSNFTELCSVFVLCTMVLSRISKNFSSCQRKMYRKHHQAGGCLSAAVRSELISAVAINIPEKLIFTGILIVCKRTRVMPLGCLLRWEYNSLMGI